MGEIKKFGDGGQTQRFVYWVAWKGKVWLFLKIGRWDFLFFLQNYFFGGVKWGVVREMGLIFYFLFFCDIVI